MSLGGMHSNTRRTGGFRKIASVILMTPLPHYWTNAIWIYQWPLDSPHEQPVMQDLTVFSGDIRNQLLNKQSRSRWFEMQLVSGNVTVLRFHSRSWSGNKFHEWAPLSRQCLEWKSLQIIKGNELTHSLLYCSLTIKFTFVKQRCITWLIGPW